MTHDLTMTHRLGVFATEDGWLLADDDRREWFADWNDAVSAALKRAHVARWRGAEVEVVAQDHPGGTLVVIEAACGSLAQPIRGVA
jgi:hypothetical protein